MSAIARMALALLMTACVSMQVQAHQASDAFLVIQAQPLGSPLLHYSIAVRDLEEVFEQLDANGDRQLTQSELQASVPAITRWLASGLDMMCANTRVLLDWAFDGVERRSDGAHARFRSTIPASCQLETPIFVAYRLLGTIDPDHRMILSWQQSPASNAVQLNVLAPDGAWFRVGMASAGSSVAGVMSFVALGFKHIMTGADHIAFVLGLLLGVALLERWRSLLLTLTAFTLGHSVTLAAASLGWVAPGAWVEPVIALSVGVVALMNLFAVSWRWLEPAYIRAVLGGLFGLVHGLGFSGAMTEAQVPASAMLGALFGFNLGVELGQLAIVALWAALYMAFARRRLHAEWMGPVASASLLLVALYWFIERTVGIA